MNARDEIKKDRRKREKMARSVKRAMAKVLPLCLFSLLISGFICSVANDMYAFVKSNKEISLSVATPYSLEELSKLLGEKDIVDNPTVFWLYVKSKHKIDEVEAFTGDITLNASMSYREILSELS